MTGQKNRRRNRSKRERQNQLQQMPFGQIQRAIKPFDLISDAQLEAIHQASIALLRDTGIEFMNQKALKLFSKAGACVDFDRQLVRMDEDLVLTALASAPQSFTLTPRNPQHKLKIGGDYWCAMSVAGPPQVHDEIKGRRPGNMEDYRTIIRLAQYFNAIHGYGYHPVSPLDVPANTRHLDCFFVTLSEGDKVQKISAIGRERVYDAVDMAAIARGREREDVFSKPEFVSTISVNSPRRVDDAMIEGLFALAETGQVASITPFTLMGAMTPVTLAAALAQQNAEALAVLTLSQLYRPGCKVLYGAFTSNVDLRSGAPAFGTPENARATMIAGQLARKYNLPYRSSNACSANLADGQAAYESTMSLWAALISGAHFIHHGAGWLEGGLKASFEKLVMDAELLQQMARVFEPFQSHAEDFALETIHAVQPGGHFFGEAHTLGRYQDAFYTPFVSDWSNHETWEAQGAQSTRARLTKLWCQALEDFEAPPMDIARKEALSAFVVKRKAFYGTREPI